MRVDETLPVLPLATDADIASVWRRYRETRQRADRDLLLLHYAPLVKYVAGRLGSGLPQFVETADLVSYGLFGLIDAMERFDPDRGFKFETFAVARVRGAIFDELRRHDWVPRSVRTKIRAIETACATLQSTLNRTPSESEIAEELVISVPELRKLCSQVALSNVVALDEILHQRGSMGEESSAARGSLFAEAQTAQPGDALEAREQSEALAAAVNRLPERDRIVISLYFYERLTLAEIGQVLGITESRVCQLHARARATLKKLLVEADA